MSAPDHTDSLDPAALARGASAGFTVLVVGELLGPLASRIDPTLGPVWLSLVGAAGFTAAGLRVGLATRTWLQGALAAEAAFVLTVPLRLIAGLGQSRRALVALVVSAAFAIVLGAVAGALAGKARRPAAAAVSPDSAASRGGSITTPSREPVEPQREQRSVPRNPRRRSGTSGARKRRKRG